MAAHVWRRVMVARDPLEGHRASTPLELLFDLCFVVAVAQTAGQLHHGLADGEALITLVGYSVVFFAIWWAWMNFTWFASAYDCDDVPYRLLTLLQITGVLILAAGVPSAFINFDFRISVIGYIIMRLALIGQWLRAAHDYPPGRKTALRYAIGIAVLQVGWIARLALTGTVGAASFVLLGVLETAVPIWAVSAAQPTSWHPDHIAERYGLFTLIVLGECVLAATTAIEGAVTENGLSWPLAELALGSLCLVFGTWWSYFKTPVGELLRESRRKAFLWGYGHYFVFAAIAALGAGLSLAAESALHTAHVSDVTAALAVAVPVVVYLLMLILVDGPLYRAKPVPMQSVVLACGLILVIAFSANVLGTSLAVLLMGIVLAGLVAFHMLRIYRTSST